MPSVREETMMTMETIPDEFDGYDEGPEIAEKDFTHTMSNEFFEANQHADARKYRPLKKQTTLEMEAEEAGSKNYGAVQTPFKSQATVFMDAEERCSKSFGPAGLLHSNTKGIEDEELDAKNTQ